MTTTLITPCYDLIHSLFVSKAKSRIAFPLQCNLFTLCSFCHSADNGCRFVAVWLVSALACTLLFSKCEEQGKCNKEGVSPFAHAEATHAVTQRGWETDRGKWILQRLNHNTSLSDSVTYLCNCSSHTQSLSHSQHFFCHKIWQ